MLPCGSSALDFLEENKENIPLDGPLVLPVESKTEEIDVVTVPTSSDGHILLTPCMSQSSGASTMSPGSIRLGGEEDADSDDGETTSRKEKSLGLLCQRFLVAMAEETRISASNEVHLESVAKKMNVEKRRIYDIVNVMEALDAMSKTNKSFYRWNGLQDLPRLMFELQHEAALERLPERVLRVEQAMCSFTELAGKRTADTVGTFEEKPLETSIPTNIKSRIETRDRQGRNSLAQLCRRFLMVLLSNPKSNRRVSLDVASTVLIKDPETEGFEPPSRSRCRRLYDIANVLVALGLIKKVHYLFGTKKIPLFVYCGPEPDEFAKYDASSSLEKILAASVSAPQTPLMKNTTTAMANTLNLGKRSHSIANLNSSNAEKMPRIKSEHMLPATSTSLMMFAELAAERLRLESLAARSMPKPQAQNPFLPQAFSPLNLSNFVLPSKPMWTPLRASPLLSSPLSSSLPQSGVKTSSPKHSVSHILGNRTNALDHRQSSAFQPVKKTPFGALHNLPNRL